jgi:hypothetical protein
MSRNVHACVPQCSYSCTLYSCIRLGLTLSIVPAKHPWISAVLCATAEAKTGRFSPSSAEFSLISRLI